MTEDEPTEADTGEGAASIEATVDRVEEIIDRLESGDPGLAEAKRLRDEGRALIEDLHEELDADAGEVVELDDDA